MRLSVLMENTAGCEGAAAEHGLSLYLQTSKHSILFDMGQTDAFAVNAALMGIDLAGADIAVLSHGHYDHGGGLHRFLQLNDAAPVYLSRHAFGPYYHGTDKYIGLDAALADQPRLRFVEGQLQLDDELALCDCNDQPCTLPIESFGLTTRTQDGFAPETFRHEQYLLVNENGRRILVSGCAHKGVVNLVRWFEPDVVIGGFHMMKLDVQNAADRQKLDAAAQVLLQSNAQYYTGHCTGDAAFEYLKQTLGDRLHPIHAGQTLDI